MIPIDDTNNLISLKLTLNYTLINKQQLESSIDDEKGERSLMSQMVIV